jgi:hypothetical protein
MKTVIPVELHDIDEAKALVKQLHKENELFILMNTSVEHRIAETGLNIDAYIDQLDAEREHKLSHDVAKLDMAHATMLLGLLT